MGKEIERKFLIKNDHWRQQVSGQVSIRQGYMASQPTCSVRVRIADKHATLNIKGATLTISRTEYEYAIPVPDAQELLANMCEGPIIEKTRYIVKYRDHTWEIDEFLGANQGLLVAEIELKSEDESFDLPEWIGEEVSEDPRYYNVCLVEHPYTKW